MNKKKTILIGALLAVALIVLAISFLYSPTEGGIYVLPLSSLPGDNAIVVSISPEDLILHPSLKRALETSESIIITQNPIHLLQYGDRCINESEAMTIADKFGVMYQESDSSPAKSRYIKWNNTYYQVQAYRI
ncbi:MAG: hypothetical protein LBL85_03235 [Methanocalculaceae archaeon]|jgi:hypothetical protein|nr:hypothetical protein [Methanocalculaceae archaeon]